ncbi:MAG TPA: phage holin family protein [Pseudolysinimonas sp.]|nr:phage holin family protein [Pseudolysinimonas sp.]
MSNTPHTDHLASPDRSARARRPRSLGTLLGSVPNLVHELVTREIELFKTELIGKLKALGIGAGVLAAAVLVLLAMIGVLLTSAVLALGQVMPGWLAALVVAAALLIIAVILALIGQGIFKRGVPPIPTESIDSISRDIRAIKGIGKRESSR